MVYIYRKRAGTKDYYYLRASARKGNRIVVKDLAYLGSSLDEVQKTLHQLPRYAVPIRKAYKTIHAFLESNRYVEKVKKRKLKKDDWLGNRLFDVEACAEHYRAVFSHLPELTKQEIMKSFVIEFAFNTASIEGNTIKLDEAKQLLDEGITPKNKSLREMYDLQNIETVFNDLMKNQNGLSHELILNIHAGLMKNIDPRVGYRTTDVRVFKATFEATPAPYVKTDMNLLLGWYAKHENLLHPLVLAALFHHQFEKIHPFMDGNGRTGRLLFNHLLLRHGYPPLIIPFKRRREYLAALRAADAAPLTATRKKEYQKLVDFAADVLAAGYWDTFL